MSPRCKRCIAPISIKPSSDRVETCTTHFLYCENTQIHSSFFNRRTVIKMPAFAAVNTTHTVHLSLVFKDSSSRSGDYKSPPRPRRLMTRRCYRRRGLRCARPPLPPRPSFPLLPPAGFPSCWDAPRRRSQSSTASASQDRHVRAPGRPARRAACLSSPPSGIRPAFSEGVSRWRRSGRRRPSRRSKFREVRLTRRSVGCGGEASLQRTGIKWQEKNGKNHDENKITQKKTIKSENKENKTK